MQLNYKQSGQGQPLIIMHGLFGSLDNWSTLAKQLAIHHEVWLLDMPNHGRSPHTNEFNYPDMAAAVAEFIEQQNISDPVLLGHSMGGKVVMHMAFQDELAYKAAIVVDIAPKAYPVHHDNIIKALQAVPVNTLATRSEAETVLRAHIDQQDVILFLMKNLTRAEGGGYRWKMNLDLIAREIEQVGQAMPEGAVLDLPTCFIRGGDSDYILDEDEADIARRFSNYQLHTVARAGHWVHAQQPAALLQIVQDFTATL